MPAALDSPTSARGNDWNSFAETEPLEANDPFSPSAFGLLLFSEPDPDSARDLLGIGSVLGALTFGDIGGTLSVDQLPPGSIASLDTIGEDAIYFFNNTTGLPQLISASEAAAFIGTNFTFADIGGTISIDQLPAGSVATLDAPDADALYSYNFTTGLPQFLERAGALTFLDIGFSDIGGTLSVEQLPPGTAATVDTIGEDALFFFDDSTSTPSLIGSATAAAFIATNLSFADLQGTIAFEQFPAGSVATLDSIDEDGVYFFDNTAFVPKLMGHDDFVTWLLGDVTGSGALIGSPFNGTDVSAFRVNYTTNYSEVSLLSGFSTTNNWNAVVDVYTDRTQPVNEQAVVEITAEIITITANNSINFSAPNITGISGSGVVDGQQLFDNSHVLSLDAGERTLGNLFGQELMDWSGEGKLYGAWYIRSIGDTGNETTTLNPGGFSVVDSAGTTYFMANNGPPGKVMVDNLYDVSGVAHLNIDLLNRKLYNPDGTTVAIDYGTNGSVVFFDGIVARIVPFSDPHDWEILAPHVKTNSVEARDTDVGVTIGVAAPNNVFIPNLPTSDPSVTNQLWNSGGMVVLSGFSGGGVTNVSATTPIISSGGSTPNITIQPASSSDDGSMSAADKTKLDAITGTNTGDQDLSGYVPTTRTINGHALSSNVTVTPTDLGLVIGTNVQAWDADLDTLAGLTATTNNFIVSVASAWASRTPTQVKSTLAISYSDLSGSAPVQISSLSLATPNLIYATPITFSNSSGAWTGTLSLNTQTANTILAGPTTGSAATPAFRALVAADIPAIAESGVTNLVTDLAAKQPLDSDLTTIAGLTATTDNFIVSVSSAWASRTPSQVRTTLGLVVGTNVQAYDADLDTWATVTPASGIATFLTTPSSANLAAAVTDETGSGALMFNTSPKIVTSVLDTNANTLLGITATPSAVNHITLANSATSTLGGTIGAAGTGTDLDISLVPKGAGRVLFPTGATATPSITFSGHPTTGMFDGGGNAIFFTFSGVNKIAFGQDTSANIKMVPTGLFNWAATTSLGGSSDLGFYRNAAGVMEINNGNAGTFRDLKCRDIYGDPTGSTTHQASIPTAAATSTAGNTATFRASDAIAGTSTAGAAAGGDVTLQSGDAKRLTSGNAAGGDVILAAGSGIGSGAAGQIHFKTSGTVRFRIDASGFFVCPTDNTYDIGTATARPRDARFSRDVYTGNASFLIRTTSALTGGGTGSVPTLTAGPAAGNPTKWLPIDDNGTTRYVPAW